MNKKDLVRLLTVVLLVLVSGLGCSQSDSDRPATHPVTGTVTYKGELVDGATVAFQSVDGTQGAMGVTDSDGKYTLTTFQSGDGAVPGEYRVKIFKHELQGGGAAAGGEDGPPSVAVPDQPVAKPKDLLPAKYANVTKSGLTATVGEEGNEFDFSLED